MKTFHLLTQDTGRIPPHTECPFLDKCDTANNGKCKHKGKEHEQEFSCGLARMFDMVSELKDGHQVVNIITADNRPYPQSEHGPEIGTPDD